MLYFIVNPTSGKNKSKKSEDIIIRELEKRNIGFTIAHTLFPGHATQLAEQFCEEEDCEALIAVGGDGTVHEIINGMDMSVPLGIIPSGTGNDFARSAGISYDTLHALEAVLSGIPTPTDIMDINGEYCLNVAGCGFDVEVLEKEAAFRKIFRSRFGYYASLISTLIHYHRYDVTVQISDDEFSSAAFMLAAANGKYFGGGMPVSPESSPFDGIMDIVIIKRVPMLKLPFLIGSFFKGTHLKHTGYVSTYRCNEITVQLRQSSNMELDGKISEILPAKIKLLPGKINLLTGQKYETQKKEKP